MRTKTALPRKVRNVEVSAELLNRAKHEHRVGRGAGGGGGMYSGGRDFRDWEED